MSTENGLKHEESSAMIKTEEECLDISKPDMETRRYLNTEKNRNSNLPSTSIKKECDIYESDIDFKTLKEKFNSNKGNEETWAEIKREELMLKSESGDDDSEAGGHRGHEDGNLNKKHCNDNDHGTNQKNVLINQIFKNDKNALKMNSSNHCDYRTRHKIDLDGHVITKHDKNATTKNLCNPVHDIICSLLETPFSKLGNTDRTEIILNGRPTPPLNVLRSDKKQGQTFSRSFKIEWYASHQWLCGSYFKQSLFCWPCLLIAKGRNKVWVYRGFSDLKNLSANIKKHELSKEHMSSCLGLKRLEMKTSTTQGALGMQSSLSLKLYNEEVRKNRNLLNYLIDVTCHLAKQELSFRGHDEKCNSSASVFHETLNLIIKRDIETQEHLKKIGIIFLELYKTIQNDLIVCISEYLMETIHKEINESLFFALQVDDTTDILEKSQCAISVRYVNNYGKIQERFLGFYDVGEDRTVESMYNLITTALKPFDYKNKLVAQCYDGACMIIGSLNCLQNKIKYDAPTALFTYCNAHRLTLVLQNGLKNIKSCRIYFASTTSIPDFFHQSAKRAIVLDTILGKNIPSSSNYKWASRSKIIHLIDSEWESLKSVFEKIIVDRSSASVSINGAKGYLKLMTDIEFSFLTSVYRNIFDITDSLFDTLQKYVLDITYCIEEVFLAKDHIQSLRSEAKFDQFFEIAELRITAETPPTKKRKLSSTFKEDEKSSLQVLFYEIVDNIVTHIEVIFADMSHLLYFSLVDSTKFKEYRSKFPTNLVINLMGLYNNIFDAQRLINELGVIYHDEQFEKLDLESILKSFIDLRDIFPESYKLFVLITTIPVTSMQVGRHFSCLKRIKTYSRNAANNEGLSSSAVISIEKDLFCALQETEDFTETIINKFSLIKDINLMYKK